MSTDEHARGAQRTLVQRALHEDEGFVAYWHRAQDGALVKARECWLLPHQGVAQLAIGTPQDDVRTLDARYPSDGPWGGAEWGLSVREVLELAPIHPELERHAVGVINRANDERGTLRDPDEVAIRGAAHLARRLPDDLTPRERNDTQHIVAEDLARAMDDASYEPTTNRARLVIERSLSPDTQKLLDPSRESDRAILDHAAGVAVHRIRPLRDVHEGRGGALQRDANDRPSPADDLAPGY
jgi:hypothetical protein